MAKLSLKSLGPKVAAKRGDRGIRQTAKEIGVSPATLSRVQGGHIPDLETFTKICRWLAIEPSDILGLKPTTAGSAPVSVHFKKDATLEPETAQALAQMVLAAQRALAHSHKQ